MNCDFDLSDNDEDNCVDDNSVNEDGSENGVKFFDYDKLQLKKSNVKDGNNNIEVKCYFNGSNWLCPNPLNVDLCDDIENWSNSTDAVKCESVFISDSVFHDDFLNSSN